MRESYGAGWLTQIVIVFILLFAAIICYAINFGKAFKIKNQIVEDLEYYETPRDAKCAISGYLQDVGYRKMSNKDELPADEDKDNCKGYNIDGNASTDMKDNAYYFICQHDSNVNNDDIRKVYYKVYVFWGFDLPIFGNLLNFKMTGTTKNLPYSEDWKGDTPTICR